MNNLSISDKCRVAAAWFLVKLGLLNYDDFSEAELNIVLINYFPQTIDVDIPLGTATLNCERGTISLVKKSHRVSLQIPQEFKIDVLGNPIYLARIITHVSAKPHYDKYESCIQFLDVSLDNIEWIDDEYSLVKDTSAILKQLSSMTLTNALTSPLKQIFNTVTGGIPQSSLHYLQSLAHDSKQRVLTNHKPAIEEAILSKLASQNLSVKLDEKLWRHYLFSRIGTRITVEQHQLRFWLS